MSVSDAARKHETKSAQVPNLPDQPRIEGDSLVIPLNGVEAITLRNAIAAHQASASQPVRVTPELLEAAEVFEDDDLVERYLAQVVRERVLRASGEAAAALLFDIARQLGWGSGDPLVDAGVWLSRAIEKFAELPSPSASPPKPKKRIIPAGHEKLHTLAERDGGWRCHWCDIALIDICSDDADLLRDERGRLLIKPESTKRLATKDHLIPQSMNGSHDPANLVLACQACNTKRGAYA